VDEGRQVRLGEALEERGRVEARRRRGAEEGRGRERVGGHGGAGEKGVRAVGGRMRAGDGEERWVMRVPVSSCWPVESYSLVWPSSSPAVRDCAGSCRALLCRRGGARGDGVRTRVVVLARSCQALPPPRGRLGSTLALGRASVSRALGGAARQRQPRQARCRISAHRS
jgi:hypothetical protein